MHCGKRRQWFRQSPALFFLPGILSVPAMSGTAPSAEPSAVVSVLCGAAFRSLCAFSRLPCVVSRLPDGSVSAVLTLVRAACPPVAAHRRHFAFRCFGWRSLSFGFAGKKPMSAHNVPRNLSGCLCGGTKPCENLLPPVRAGRMCQASVPDKRN